MTWTKLDDSFYDCPKIIDGGNEVAGAFARSLSYCGRHNTDGAIPRSVGNSLAGRKRIAVRLVELGLWVSTDTGYLVPDYLDFNPSKEEVAATRGKAIRRSALSRDRELIAAIRERDGSFCRYCGQEVIWTDRRGKNGGTYDHIDPEGPNALENVVVACRGCNARKGQRTPDQAGMVLNGFNSDLDRT